MKELLKKLGLDDETINKIIKGMEEENIYTTKEENLEIRYSKLKKEKEDLEEELKEANITLKGLKKDNKDVEELQNTITDYETTIENLKKERDKERKRHAVESVLKDEGAIDVDYLLYKMGGVDELEMDEDGNIEDLSNIVKDLKEEYTNFFKQEKEEIKDTLKPRVLENKLPQGGENKGFTLDEIKAMTPEEINENWDTIKEIKFNE